MYRKEGIRWTLILLLVLLLAAPALAGERMYQESAGWLVGGGLWQRLVQWFQLEVLGATQCDAGSYIDPDGRCVAGPETAGTIECDKGSSIDPDGRCIAAAAATECEKGSSIDPNGGCVGG